MEIIDGPSIAAKPDRDCIGIRLVTPSSDEAVQGDGRIRTGVLPAGRHATLTYDNHGRRANGRCGTGPGAGPHAGLRR